MALPPNAYLSPQPLDPKDILDQKVNLRQDDSDQTFLQPNESAASFTLVATAEATAAGLQIMTGGQRDPALSGNMVRFWLQIASGMQENAAFNGAGLTLGIELTITTNSTPSRTKQRTLAFQVAQQ